MPTIPSLGAVPGWEGLMFHHDPDTLRLAVLVYYRLVPWQAVARAAECSTGRTLTPLAPR
eukprot:714293-Rhodomonas_salina.1